MNERRFSEEVINNKVIDTIEKYNMIEDGEGVVVALSGGPDSMCLLSILDSIKERYNMKLYAAHVNHMIRGEEADKDEEACRSYCKDLGIQFFSLRAGIEEIAKERKISVEMAGRDIRYGFFEEVRKKTGASKIAVAHNMNDQAETVLMHMMRGTGIEGLIGIKPVRDGLFIRPIIQIMRSDIEDYIKYKNVPARIDATNLEPIYSRNKIRLELIPYMEEHFNKDIMSTITRMSELIERDNNYIEENVSKVFRKYCYISKEKVIIYKGAFKCHPAIVSRVLRKAITEWKGNIINIQSVHIDSIIKLQKSETGKVAELPGEIIATNVYGDIEIAKRVKKVDLQNFKASLVIGENRINELGINIIVKKVAQKEGLNYKNCDHIKYFNVDNVGSISLRFRANGDKFIPLGMKGGKKLKDIFIDMKIPREKRDTIPLLCFDNDISWIIGYKISDKYKVHDGAKNVIEVKVERQD